MSRHRQNLSDGEAIVEGIESDNKMTNLINSKTVNEIVSKDRSVFLLNIIELNGILEDHRVGGRNSIAIAKGKNVLQSLSYLILNDVFYRDIILIRRELNIPADGFIVKEGDKGIEKVISGDSIQYNSKQYNHNYDKNKAYKKIEDLIKRYGICRKTDLSDLAHIVMMFLSYQMDFYSFFQMITPVILNKEKEPILAGLDTIVKEYENSEDNFFTCEWEYKLYPFTSLTNLEKLFPDFLMRELITEKSFKKYVEFVNKKFKTAKDMDDWKSKNRVNGYYEVDYINFLVNKFKIYDNIKLIKSKEKLDIFNKKDYILLNFTTTYFTKTSDVIRLYENKFKIIKNLLRTIESNLKLSQKKYLSEQFERNHMIARLRKRGLTYDEVSAYMHDDNKSLGDDYRNKIKVEWSEFNANIEKSLRRKIIF